MIQKPNIVFIFPDGYQSTAIGALGHPDIITPNLDTLVQNGTVFTNCYINGSNSGAVCIPSRAMMLTGRHLFSLEGNGHTLPPNHTLLPEAFKQAGYDTFISGHWHQDQESLGRSFTHGGQIKGLVANDGWYENCDGHWHVPVCPFSSGGVYNAGDLIHADSPIVPFKNPFTRYKSHGIHSTEVFNAPAIKFLKNQPYDKPFFMYLPFVAVHDPFQSPDTYGALYDESVIQLPENYAPEHPFDNGELQIRDENLEKRPRSETAIRRRLKDYYAMITHTDRQIGKLLNTLKQSGHDQNTIVVFAADHGIANGQHGLIGKQNCYDHSHKVPLIFCGPGIKENTRHDGLCYLLDLFPTLMELAGIECPRSVEGISIAPALKDPDAALRSLLFHAYTDVQRGIRDNRYKLIEYRVDGETTIQLFDLRDDPWEAINLAYENKHVDRVADMRRDLHRWQTELNDIKEWSSFWDDTDTPLG